MTVMEAFLAAEGSIISVLKKAGLVEGLSLTPTELESSSALLFWETHLTSKKASEKKYYATFNILSCNGTVYGDGSIISRTAIVSLNVFSRNKDVSILQIIARAIAGGETTKITNGDFVTDTIWVKGSGWSINTQAIATAALGNLEHTFAPTIAKTYGIIYDATVTHGSFAVTLGGVTGNVKSESGTFTSIITARSTDVLAFAGIDAFTGTINNVIVYDISNYYALSFLTAINDAAIADHWTFEMENPLSYDTENQMFVYSFILKALVTNGN